jgi:hypothetical protein
MWVHSRLSSGKMDPVSQRKTESGQTRILGLLRLGPQRTSKKCVRISKKWGLMMDVVGLHLLHIRNDCTGFFGRTGEL